MLIHNFLDLVSSTVLQVHLVVDTCYLEVVAIRVPKNAEGEDSHIVHAATYTPTADPLEDHLVHMEVADTSPAEAVGYSHHDTHQVEVDPQSDPLLCAFLIYQVDQ